MNITETKLRAGRPYLRLVLPEPRPIPADTNTYPSDDQDHEAAIEAASSLYALELKDDAVEIALNKLKDGAPLTEVIADVVQSTFVLAFGLGRIGSEHQLRQARLEVATLSVLLDAKKKVA